MKKTVSLLLAALMLAGALSIPALAEGKRVLHVVSWDTATGGYLAAQEAAFEAAHPEIDLVYVDVASQDYYTKTSTMLSGGDTSDVFDVKELSDLQNWIAQDLVESIEQKVAEENYDLSHFLGVDNSYRAPSGELYALPYRSDFWVLFYNKTLFDKAGVDYPTNDMTWEQYVELARKMTSGEGIDKVYGTHYHTWLSAVVMWAVCDGKYNLVQGDYEPVRPYYNIVQTLEDEGVVQEYSELRAANLHYSGVFYRGNVAMLPMGYWFAATLIAEKAKGTFDFDWSFVSVPHAEGVPAGSSFGSGTAAAINKNAANKEDAWTFISWRAGLEGAKATASVGTRPAYVSEEVAQVMASADGFPQDEACRAALVPTQMSLEWPIGQNANEIKTIMLEEHTAIMSRETSLDEGLESITSRVAEVIGE